MIDSRTPIIEGWHLKALILSIIVATSGYLMFSLWGGWHDVVDAFTQIGLPGTMAALTLSLINYGLRFVRWQQYLQHLGYRIAAAPSWRIYLSGFALTTTPGKAGEAFRGILLKQHGVPFPTTFAALLSERLSDLMAIVLLTLVGLSQYPQARTLVIAGIAAVGLILVCLSSQRLLEAVQRRSNRQDSSLMASLGHLARTLQHTRRCHTADMLGLATALSVLSWSAEALAFYLVLEWLGTDIGFAFATFVYALSLLAGALSFVPGGLGGTEAVMASLLVFKGVATPVAVAATVFIRLATLWFAVVLGLAALYRSRHGELP